MGCCQSLPLALATKSPQSSEFIRKDDFAQNELILDYLPNVIDLYARSKENYKEEDPPLEKLSEKEKQAEKLADAPNTSRVQHQEEPEAKIVSGEQIKKEELPQLAKPTTRDFSVSSHIFLRLNNSKISINDFYEIKTLLGQGGFGKVYKALHKITGMVRAVKVIPKSKLQREGEEKLIEETNIMVSMDHPNIVKLFEMFIDDNAYYLVSQYCDGGELFEKIRHISELTERTVANYMKQIISAVLYCHRKGIVHRDLKPENILFDSKSKDSIIQVIDFGASAKLSHSNEKLQKRIGTVTLMAIFIIHQPFYVAPEVLAANYNEKCDIWSCGIILYILLCGYPPFFGHNEIEVLQKVKKGVYTFDSNDWSKVSIQAKDLIRRMLFYEPEKRISAEEAYNHPWIQHNNSKGTLKGSVLSNLSDFHVKNKLKHAIYEFISVQVMTNREKDELRKNFEMLDKDGDGMVCKTELFDAYRKLYNDKIKAQQIVDEIFNMMDANGSGKVDFSEFVAAAINKQKLLSRQKIETSFKLFDLDGNGFITKNEIEQLFGGGGDIDDHMWNEILQDCDRDHDGMVSNIHSFCIIKRFLLRNSLI